MKQTVEEAMSQCAKERGLLVQTDGQYLRGYSHGFKDAAAWQKEQGIDWISVKAGVPEMNKVVIACLDSLEIVMAEYNSERKVFRGFFKGHKVTHYAYINLPKTTQP